MDDPDPDPGQLIHFSQAHREEGRKFPTALLKVEIVRSSAKWSELGDIDHALVEAAQAARSTIVTAPTNHEGLTIVLSSNMEVQGLNKTFRGQDKPTNVLSFPFGNEKNFSDHGSQSLGDIVLAFETILQEADERAADPRHYACHLVVHGVLHLLGFDHKTDSDAQIMEELESRIAGKLGMPDPYQVTDMG